MWADAAVDVCSVSGLVVMAARVRAANERMLAPLTAAAPPTERQHRRQTLCDAVRRKVASDMTKEAVTHSTGSANGKERVKYRTSVNEVSVQQRL